MKLLISTSAVTDEDLEEAVSTYQDMFGDITGAMKRIMAHPEAAKFNKPPPRARFVYRAVSISDKDLKKYEKTGVYKPTKSNGFDGKRGKVLPYSLDPDLALNAVLDLEIGDTVLVFKKSIEISAFALNFSEMLKKSEKLEDFEPSMNEEKEVWMHATPEYTIFHKSEQVAP